MIFVVKPFLKRIGDLYSTQKQTQQTRRRDFLFDA